MARPRLADRPVEKKISLPTSIVTKVELLLYSELEGRVPIGKWSQFIEEAVRAKLKGMGQEDETESA